MILIDESISMFSLIRSNLSLNGRRMLPFPNGRRMLHTFPPPASLAMVTHPAQNGQVTVIEQLVNVREDVSALGDRMTTMIDTAEKRDTERKAQNVLVRKNLSFVFGMAAFGMLFLVPKRS